MKVLGSSVPIFATDLEAAVLRYEALTGETVKQRFDLPEHGIRIAVLGSLTIIAGAVATLGALREVRATLIVDSLAEYESHLRSTGGSILQGPGPTPAGRNMIARDAGDVVFEFVELRGEPTIGAP
jgi:predicted enzyme related to lactoylglutathione lyase